MRHIHILSAQLIATSIAMLLAASLGAVFPGAESAFSPLVRSSFWESLLQDNYALEDAPPLPAKQGLSHPFSSFGRLKGALKEAMLSTRREQALIQYASRDSSLDYTGELNFVLGYDYRDASEGGYGFLYKGVRYNSTINRRFRMRALWWNGAFWGDLGAAGQSPLIDGYHTTVADEIRLDNLTADISYRDPHFTFSLGRGRFPVMDNVSGSLVLSGSVNDYGYFLAEAMVGDFALSFLHGSLLADSSYVERLADRRFPDKYVALHEVSYRPGKWRFFAGETVIYGDRGIDLNYMLPHTFWRVTEHNQWDRDNVLIYAGLGFSPNERTRLYLNAVLDEFSYSRFFSNWWGNKWALQGGIAFHPGLWKLSDGTGPRFVLEGTAVRPWTYTHYQNHTMYSQDGRPLGYTGGSNLVNATLEANLPIRKGLRADAQVSFTRQGSYGNSWQLNYSDYFPADVIDSATAVWFEGTRADTWSYCATLRCDILAHHAFYLGGSAADSRETLHAGWQFIF